MVIIYRKSIFGGSFYRYYIYCTCCGYDIKKENPHIIALRFYTPIFYLLQKYDMHPEMIYEAKQELTLMIQEFCNTYAAEEH